MSSGGWKIVGLSEVELRLMLARARAIVPARRPGRWIVTSRLHGRRWTVVVDLGIEVIDPVSATAEEIYGVFDALGLRRPSPGALSPLTAA
jgi:hypothetical protein